MLVIRMARACGRSGTRTANDELCGAFCWFITFFQANFVCLRVGDCNEWWRLIT